MRWKTKRVKKQSLLCEKKTVREGVYVSVCERERREKERESQT